MRSSQPWRGKNGVMLLVCVAAWVSVPAVSDDTSRGLEIARMMKERERGFENYTAEMNMVLISVSGKERVRRLRVKTREVKDDGDQSLAIFDAPGDVRGTAFLSHTHITRDDDQWLYLPSLKRVKRISPGNKTAPFMGSEFSYEDLGSVEVEKYTYIYVRDEVLNGADCFVIDRFPVDKHSGYSRQRVWVEKKRYLALKVDYFNRREEIHKTLFSSNFKLYMDRFWRAHDMRMQNHISRKSSVLYWQQFQFRQPLNPADFHPNSLKRIR